MPRYKVTTPDTARAPGTNHADFQAGEIAHSPVCVRHLLEDHNFTGCTVHRKRRGNHWELIFDSSSCMDALWWIRWQNVEINQ